MNTPMFKILSVCKGGGYQYCRTDPPHPRRNTKGLYPLHRVLMENKLGRLLEPGEIVHHKDEDKTNDKIGNLRLKDNAKHSQEHALSRGTLLELVCPCGKAFSLKKHQHDLRMKRSKSRVLYCSRACGNKKFAAGGRDGDRTGLIIQ